MAMASWCVSLLLLSAWAPSGSPSRDRPPTEPAGGPLESSGDGPQEAPGLPPRRGAVKVVRLDPSPAARSGLFKRAPHGGGPRPPFPAFLSRGRAAGPAGGPGWTPRGEKAGPRGLEARRRQGLQMWQQVSKQQGGISLGLGLKAGRQQTCSAVPYPQRVSVDGCEAVTVRNKLCFGQCSSLFVPAGGLDEGGAPRGGCSRCWPSRSHALAVALPCGPRGPLERRVMVVDECRCEEAGPGELL